VEKLRNYSVGIAMIATNNYIELWKKSAESLNNIQFHQVQNIQIHLFTDQPEDAEIWWLEQNSRIKLKTYKIPNYVWPDATLLRYEIISNHAASLTEEILVYLDSDMLVLKEFISTLTPYDWRSGIALVMHPGFYRTKGLAGLRERIQNPYLWIQDLKFIWRLKNGMGAWETNPISSAHVRRSKRICYVHGAIWLGLNIEFKSMIKLLEKNSKKDKLIGIIPVWHDESHLNWFNATHDVTVLDSRYSWYSEYKHLQHLEPYVESMNKEKMHFMRQSESDTSD